VTRFWFLVACEACFVRMDFSLLETSVIAIRQLAEKQSVYSFQRIASFVHPCLVGRQDSQ
ncbi:hypothetical protein ACFLQ5_03865, partial [Bacteroidota bacterium]